MKAIHPGLAILTFLLFALGVAHGGWTTVALAWAMTLPLLLFFPPHWATIARLVIRMRWLWLSLLVLYFWFTPGRLLIPSLGAWSPTLEGVGLGWLRVAVLLVMVVASQLLIQLSGREGLVAGLVWLLAPLRLVGVPVRRLSLRLSLVLDLVPKIDPLSALREAPEEGLRRVSSVAGRMVREVLKRAERGEGAEAASRPVDVSPPAPLHWLLPLAVGGLLWWPWP